VPPERRNEVGHTTCQSALNRSRIPGADYCVNPYLGCAHACVYCYAAFMMRFSHHSGQWGSFVDAKDDVAEVLARQTRRRRRGTVMLSSVTDAYQPAEHDLGLTRACLGVLAEAGLGLSILTKSDLVLRDVDLLLHARGLLRTTEVTVGFSIVTLSDDLAALLEPGAPPPSRRLEALRALSDAGVGTWVFIAPVIPGLTDSRAEVRALAKKARAGGAREVEIDPLNFYPAAVGRLGALIREHRPAAFRAFRAAAGAPKRWREQARRDLQSAAREGS
jgi:DNA repair photolyase